MYSEEEILMDINVQCIVQAKSQSEQLNHLISFKSRIHTVFSEEQKRSTVVVLLRRIVVVGEESEAAFFNCLVACGPILALQVAEEILRQIPSHAVPSALVVDSCLKVIHRFLLTEYHRESFLFDLQFYTSKKAEARVAYLDGFVSRIILLPGLMANACHTCRMDLPKWATPETYVRCIIEHACLYRFVDIPGTEVGKFYLQFLVNFVASRQGGGAIAAGLKCFYTRQLLHTHLDYSLIPRLKTMIATDVLCTMRPQECAELLFCIVKAEVREAYQAKLVLYQYSGVSDFLESMCVPILQTSKVVRDSFVRLTILQYQPPATAIVLDLNMVRSVLTMLLEPKTEEQRNKSETISSFAALLESVASAWSQSTFVDRLSIVRQQRISYFIWNALLLLPGPVDPLSNLTATLLDGVTLRLSCTTPQIRLSGMRVAVELAKKLGEELHFEELDNLGDISSELGVEMLNEAEELFPKDGHAGEQSRLQIPKTLIDPDAEYFSDDSESGENVGKSHKEDDDSDWNDIDDHHFYSLDDSEDDLAGVTSPRYLTECLELLRTPESDSLAYHKHKTALLSLPDLVRSRPIDLVDVGESLARELLRMENKFSLDNFETSVSVSVVALLVMDPCSIGSAVVHEVFLDRAFANRQCALHVLSDAAYELSGYQAMENTIDKHRRAISERSKHGRSLIGGDGIDGAPKTVARADRTRRWGGARRSDDSRAIFNRFGRIAPVWFYRLLQGFCQLQNDASLWGGRIGSMLLTELFLTLANIVECCGVQPCGDVLAKDLFQLVWSFRNADVLEVRRVVLLCAAVSFCQVRQQNQPKLIADVTQGTLYTTLRDLELNDPDTECRDLAGFTLYKIKEAVQASLASDFLL